MDLCEVSSEEVADFLLSLGDGGRFRAELGSILVAMKRGALTGPLPCAKAALVALHGIINLGDFENMEHMIRIVRLVGREMQNILPCEFSIGNVVRRVLYFIREEAANKTEPASPFSSSSPAAPSSPPPSTRRAPSPGGLSLDDDEATNNESSSGNGRRARSSSFVSEDSIGAETIFTAATFAGSRESLSSPNDTSVDTMSILKSDVIKSILDFNEELEDIHLPIKDQALDHIHNNETILVYNHCYLVEQFLRSASLKLKFSVIIAEGGVGPGPASLQSGNQNPISSRRIGDYSKGSSLFGKQGFGGAGVGQGGQGHLMAAALSKLPSVTVTLIPDSNIYAIMSRVNKVILSPTSVMANGGAFGPSGHLMIAVAAKEYSVPIIYLAATPLMTPLFPHNQTVAKAQRISPAVWSYSCNNHSSCSASSNKLTVTPVAGKPGAKPGSGGGNKESKDSTAAASASADPWARAKGAGVLKANSKTGVFPMDADELVDFNLPGLDYVEPDLVEFYITNTGCHLPSSTYRILSEFYHPYDYQQH